MVFLSSSVIFFHLSFYVGMKSDKEYNIRQNIDIGKDTNAESFLLTSENMETRNHYQPDLERQMDRKVGMVKKWEVFPGRNRFCCDGRVMLSTQTGIFYLTLFLIIATTGCFFGIDAQYLWFNVSPALPILAAMQVIFVVCVLCRTALGDPGVLPRATPAEAADLERLIEENEKNKDSKNSTPYRHPPRIKEVVIKGQTFKLKYCFTCKIFRPPRASHCSVCDNCVDQFDHHCPWVGNCVGRRNYKYFFMFLVSLTIYCAYLMAVSVTAIVQRSKIDGFATAMSKGPLSPVVALIAFFSIWSVAGLAGFHSYLVCRNITTNEDIKGSYKSAGGNPFSAGSCLSNCATVLCGPLPPSLIDRRGYVTEAYLPGGLDGGGSASRLTYTTPRTANTSISTKVTVSPQAGGLNNSALRNDITAQSGELSERTRALGAAVTANGKEVEIVPSNRSNNRLPPIRNSTNYPITSVQRESLA